MTHLNLGPGREFDRIREIIRALGPQAASLGDDCAILPEAPGALVLSVDLSIEGVHFRRDWLSTEEIGWRSAAGALSDLAAEGATPIGVLVGVGLPKATPVREIEHLMRGIGAATVAAGGVVLGGDLSNAPTWIVSVTVVGRAERPVTRAGARPGNSVWVTGSLGAARAALLTWEAGGTPPPQLRNAFARPEPRVDAGKWLAAHGATAMIDLSDGLAGDARHLAAASGARLDIDLDALPVLAGVDMAAQARGLPIGAFAALGGEDYELLVTLPAGFDESQAARFQRDTRLPLTRIGSVGAGEGARFRLKGAPIALAGFDHFA